MVQIVHTRSLHKYYAPSHLALEYAKRNMEQSKDKKVLYQPMTIMSTLLRQKTNNYINITNCNSNISVMINHTIKSLLLVCPYFNNFVHAVILD